MTIELPDQVDTVVVGGGIVGVAVGAELVARGRDGVILDRDRLG